MIKHVNESEFKKETEGKKVLVDFFATWCGPCKMLGSVIEDFDKENVIDTIKIDIDENQKLANDYQIYAVPTLILLKDGKEDKRFTGYMTIDDLRSWINEK